MPSTAVVLANQTSWDKNLKTIQPKAPSYFDTHPDLVKHIALEIMDCSIDGIALVEVTKEEFYKIEVKDKGSISIEPCGSEESTTIKFEVIYKSSSEEQPTSTWREKLIDILFSGSNTNPTKEPIYALLVCELPFSP